MRRTSLDLGRLAALRLMGALASLSIVGCGARACGPSNAQLAEVARQQVCVCAKLDGEACGELATVPVRFGAGAVVFCSGTSAAGCYSPERGVEVATLDAHEGDIASGWRGEHQPWTVTSQYELLHRLRHKYLHAAGFKHMVFGATYEQDKEFACEWDVWER